MRAKPQSCSGCAFHGAGTDFSAIEGTGASGIMLVGEASGEHEQRDQLPFRPFAPAGGVLHRTIRRMGLSREQFSITNVIRCRPKNNWLEGNPHEHSAINHCRPNLDAAIHERRPKVIVALGGIALRELTAKCGESQGISHLAGYVLPAFRPVPDARHNIPMMDESENLIPVIGNFHPSYLRRGKASHQGIFARILQRAMNIAAGRDTQWLWGITPEVVSDRLGYITHPSLDDARGFLERVRASSTEVLSYDIETSESSSLDEDAREGFADTNIRLTQFSIGDRTSIAIPWDGGFRTVIRDILHTPNVKCGHNVWLFDNKVLRAAGEREGLDLRPRGTIHDTLQMFHHWQPDLPAHLQFCAQYVSFPFPWKHLAGTDLAFYGCCDVDATLRLYTFLESQLKKEQLWGDSTLGYLGQIYEVRPVLAAMEDRGLPVDDEARLKLDAEFDAAQRELGTELAAAAPPECQRVHPKQGYKGVPPEVKQWFKYNTHLEEKHLLQMVFKDSGDDPEFYHYEQRSFPVAIVDPVTGEPAATDATRWCRVYDFNPNSWQQLIAYMRARKHPVPKSKEEDDDGNQKDTTNKKELQRLARKTGDTFYLKVIEYRELTKARGTYVQGFAPGPDGCVHTTFTFDTGIGQLSSRNPNIQNFPKHGKSESQSKLFAAMRRMIAAKPGHILTEWDFKSCHVLTLGFLAEDLNYIRLARLDMHSFVTGHVLKLWDGPTILAESDDELRARFKWLKCNPKWKAIRDDQAKHAILGIGNGLKAKGLYDRYIEEFGDQKTAKKFMDVAEELFPKVFEWQKRVQKLAHEQQFLKSEFGHIRRFYEVFRWDNRKGDWGHGDQAEEAISFWLSNIAFGHIRESIKELHRLGLDEKYGMNDNIHDALEFHFPESMLEEHVYDIHPVLIAPSKVLRHPTIAPGGLHIDVEASKGLNWADMEQIDLPVTPAPTILAPTMEATA